jgi:hypothetical protein
MHKANWLLRIYQIFQRFLIISLADTVNGFYNSNLRSARKLRLAL